MDVLQNEQELNESRSEEENEATKKTYLSRFWIVTMLSTVSFFQAQQWNHWGPIGASMEVAFPGWNAGTVAMMSNWGLITFVIFVAPMCWLLSAKGLRAGMLCSTFMVFVATGLRCLSFAPVPFKVLCHAAAILNGIAGTVFLAGPSLAAAVWFPPKERTTAMAVPIALNQFGVASSGLETLLVEAPNVGVRPDDIRDEVIELLVIEFIIGTALMLIVLIYFPTKPPTPPSITSAVERYNLKTSFKSILRNRDLLLVFLSFSICSVPWEGVLNYYLSALGIEQDEASRLGAIAISTSAICVLIMGRLTDLIYGHVRKLLLVLLVATCGFLLWLCLLTWGTIPPVKWQIYMTVIGGMSANFATTPLYYEISNEIAYPCPEGLISGLLEGCLSFTGIVFLLLFYIPEIGYDWVGTYFLVTSVLCIIPLFIIQENYNRSTVDQRFSSE